MKKLSIHTFLILAFLVGCAEKTNDINMIPLTTKSDQARVLMRQFLLNLEELKWESNEELLAQVLKEDPEFVYAKIYPATLNYGSRDKTRSQLISAYENRSSVSDIEKGIIEAVYSRIIKGDIVSQNKILDALISKHPQYYELRMMSAQVKNDLANPEGVRQRLSELLELHPQSFYGHLRLSWLHFPTSEGNYLLPPDQIDLSKAEKLLEKAQNILPDSSVPTRFLGNVYRAKGDLKKAGAAYEKTLELIKNKNSDSYAGAMHLLGHVKAFSGNYSDARIAYKQAVEAATTGDAKFDSAWMSTHTYLYERNYNESLLALVELQRAIKNFDEDEEWKARSTLFVEKEKFRALSHTLNRAGSLESLSAIRELSEKNLAIVLKRVQEENERQRISRLVGLDFQEYQIWFDILFSEFTSAKKRLKKFKAAAEQTMAFNPNGMVPYFKLLGQLNLMEGNPADSIDAYSNVSEVFLADDSYHKYFVALAKKAQGDLDESKKLFESVASYNFATWQSALVKNLAKDQLESW